METGRPGGAASAGREIYAEEGYLAANPTWHVEDSPWKARHILRMLEKHGIEPRTVCEVGCGAGEICAHLHRQLAGATIHGYEISPQAYALCRPRGGDRLHFHLADLLEEETREPFDLVLAIDVIEHVPDYLGFLRRLRPRGRHHIFHIPLEMNVQAVLRARPLVSSRRRFGHLHYFSKETALMALHDVGYEVLDHAYTLGSTELPSRTRRMRLVAPLRRVAFAVNRGVAERLLGGCSLLVLTR